jgi:carboxyl-terminal processing protease
MEFNPKYWPNKVLIPLIVAVSFVGGFFVNDIFDITNVFEIREREAPTEFGDKEKGQPVELDFSLFWDAWNLVSEKHIDKHEFDLVKMRDGAISGMIEAIGDPFTSYLPPRETKQFFDDISGEFSGVGIEIGIRDGVLTVIAPLEGTPADEAGMMAGDKIIEIDEEITIDMSLDEAVKMIRGKKGTKVVLTVNRDGEVIEFPIIRDEIKIPAVKLNYINNDIAHLKVITFNGNVDSEFENAVRNIMNKKIEMIILDLRNNPGGLLNSSIKLSSYFLDKDDIVTIEDFGNGMRNEFKSDINGRLRNKKVVVLINRGSASASEIMAGALRDNNKILLVGETTFGKGSVQELENLKDKSSIKYTIARWLTPLGHSIDKTGLDPDIEVEISKEELEQDLDPQLDRAVEIVRGL